MAVHHSTFEKSIQAALQGPDTQRVARPAGRRQTQQETTMSKLARVLAIGALLTAMSLGSTAYAQDSDAPSQQAGVTQSDPSQPQPPGTPEDPGTPGDPGTTPSSTTTTTTSPAPQIPREIPVRGSSRQGRAGSTVTLSADLSRCAELTSASGVFLDHAGGRRPLAGETVTRDLRLIAQYTVTVGDAVGWGRFKVSCYRGTTTVGVGNFSFQVLPKPSPPPIWVTVTPRAGGPGTTVKLSADVRGGCDPAVAFFQDRKGRRVSGATTPATILHLTDRQLLAQYTVSSKDAVGWGRFGVSCGRTTDSYRVGYASFQVLSQTVGEPTPPKDPGGTVYHPKGPVQVPTQIDTGLGGTADRGLDPMLLLPAAGLLLIAVAVGLRLRQATRRRP
jgi:hypothetical protein